MTGSLPRKVERDRILLSTKIFAKIGVGGDRCVHSEVRRMVLEELTAHPDQYEGFVPGAWKDYLHGVGGRAWGDHVPAAGSCRGVAAEPL